MMEACIKIRVKGSEGEVELEIDKVIFNGYNMDKSYKCRYTEALKGVIMVYNEALCGN